MLFFGSYIDGENATIVAPAGYRHPNIAEWMIPTIRAELHALGSTIYEIITGKGPRYDLDLEGGDIDKLVKERQSPDISHIHLGDVTNRCWNGDFGCVLQVEKQIRVYRCSSF